MAASSDIGATRTSGGKDLLAAGCSFVISTAALGAFLFLLSLRGRDCGMGARLVPSAYLAALLFAPSLSPANAVAIDTSLTLAFVAVLSLAPGNKSPTSPELPPESSGNPT